MDWQVAASSAKTSFGVRSAATLSRAFSWWGIDGGNVSQGHWRARAWDARVEADHGPDAVWAAVSHGDVIKAIVADALGCT
jgi:broad specificity phosphatase PhoE